MPLLLAALPLVLLPVGALGVIQAAGEPGKRREEHCRQLRDGAA